MLNCGERKRKSNFVQLLLLREIHTKYMFTLYLDEVMKTVNDDLKSLGKTFTAIFTAEKPSQVSGAFIVPVKRLYGVFTLDDTENETETYNDKYGSHYNKQNTAHCTETLPLMSLASFGHFIGR